MKKSLVSKLITFIVTFVMIFSSVPITAHAEPTAENNISELKQAVDMQLNRFNANGLNTYKGTTGIFYNMKSILDQALWVNFIEQDKSLDFSNDIKNYQKSQLVDLIKKFNNTYVSDDPEGKYKGVTIDSSDANNGKFNFDTVVKDISAYCSKYLDGLNSKVGKDKIEKVVQDNKKELNYINQMCDMASSTLATINSLIPTKVTTDNKSGESTFSQVWEYKPNTKPLLDILNNGNYRKLLDKAKELSKDDLKDVDTELGTDKSLLSQFFKDGDTNKGKVVSGYYLLLSCSAVYEPFVSHVGDTSFEKALDFLTANDKDKDKIQKLFDDAKMYKKPLYYRTTDNYGKPEGSATRMDLKSFIDCMNNDSGKGGVLVTGKGLLMREKDSNAFMYFKDPKQTQNADQNKTENKDADKDKDKDADKDKAKKDSSVEQTAKNDASQQLMPDQQEITSEQQMSDPLFRWGWVSPAGGAGTNDVAMGSVIGRNIVKSCSKLKDFENKNRLLFINAFGDIVTEDDTVIIPAAANPTFVADKKPYFIYTNAFMKTYPSILSKGVYFQAPSGQDVGKYVLSMNVDGSDAGHITSGSGFNLTSPAKVGVEVIHGKTNLDHAMNRDANLSIQTQMHDFGSGVDSMVQFKNYKMQGGFLGFRGFTNNVGTSNTEFLTKTLATSYTQGSQSVLFDSDLSQLSDKDLAMIAKNYYYSVMADANYNLQKEPNGRLNEQLLAKDVIAESLNGLPNAMAYVKNYMKDYDNYVNDSSSRFVVFIKGLSKSLLDSFNTTTGVLGIKNSYQDPIFGKISTYAQQYMIYVLIVIGLLAVYKFMRLHADLLTTVVISAIAVGITYVFIYIVPVFVPTAFNMLNNNISKNLAYTSLMMKAESYGKVFQEHYDSSGRLIQATASINIYKLTDDDLDYVSTRIDVPKKDILGGNAYSLDKVSGLYVEGNVLKINLDKLFVNNPIVGRYAPNPYGGISYTLKSEKMASSSVDYYMPYSQIEQHFIDKLNKFANDFQLTRSTLRYNGMSKDSFLVNDYMQSGLFLTPGDWDKIAQTTDPEVLQQLRNDFGDNYDFLGLSEVLTSPSAKTKDSLWYKTLEQNGYFEDNQKLNDLVEYVNYNTKKFMYDNEEKFDSMSDENIIKIVSLQANMLLNQKAGTYNNELYPMFLNYEELNMGDVLLSAFTTKYDRFSSDNMNIVDYITFNYSWFNLIVFNIVEILMFVVIHLVQLLVPILYILAGIFLILRFITNKDMLPTVKGYLKSCLTIFLCYSAHCSALAFASFCAGSAWCIWVLLVVELLITEILIRLIVAVVMSKTELGNGKMNLLTPWIARKFGLDSFFANMYGTAMHMRHGARYMGKKIPDIYNRYNQDAGMDDYDDDPRVFHRIMKEQERHRGSRERYIDDISRNHRNEDDEDYDELDDYRNI